MVNNEDGADGVGERKSDRPRRVDPERSLRGRRRDLIFDTEGRGMVA